MVDNFCQVGFAMHIKWIVFAIACFRSFCFTGSVKANGTVLVEMMEQLNTTYSVVSLAFSVQNGISLLFCPFVGALLGVFTYREVCVMGGLLVASGYIFCGLFSLTIWKFFTTYIISGVGFALCVLPTVLALEDYHGTNYRTLILIVQLFQFAGVGVLPQVLQSLKDNYGLGNSFILYGALLLNLGALGFGLRQPSSKKRKTKRSLPGQSDSSNESQSFPKNLEQINVSEKGNDIPKEGKFRCCPTIFVHKTFTVTVIGQLFMYLIFISWAIFLVTLGTSRGMAEDDAVMLSTYAAIGGLAGKITAVFLSHFNKLNAFVFWMFPCLLNGLSFLACSVVTDFYILTVLAFSTGFGLAMSISGLVATMRMNVCKYHFSQAAQIFEVVSGLATLFGGIIAGAICDVTGDAGLVYAFDGVLSIVISPLVFLWNLKEEFSSDCIPYEDDFY